MLKCFKTVIRFVLISLLIPKHYLRDLDLINQNLCLLLLKLIVPLRRLQKNQICSVVKFIKSAVGSLFYLSTRTRPDITFAVCNVAKFCTNPTRYHWSAVQRIFRYLRGTCDLGIVYFKQNSCSCFGHSDADWAGDKNDRKSTSGYCFTLSSGLISWRTNKQSCVALSTAEAEILLCLMLLKGQFG